jgi:hypothetical protein
MKFNMGLIAILFGMGLAFAIAPAGNWTVLSTSYYSSATNASVLTQGGNVTNLALSSNTSTLKWAGYWGNVTGGLLLAPSSGSFSFYTWAWNASKGGEVCSVAAATGFNWAAVAATTAGVVDTTWGFTTTDPDSATNTLTQGSCAITIGGVALSTVGNFTGIGTNFETCAVDDGATTHMSDFAFCVNITTNGTLFNNQTGNYQLIMPTNNTAGTTSTDYFWLDLK